MQTFSFVHQIFHSSPCMKEFMNDENWIDKLDIFMYSPNMKKEVSCKIVPHMSPTPTPTPTPTKEITREEPSIEMKNISVVLPPLKTSTSTISVPVKNNHHMDYFEPPYTKDTIFWCIYQHVYGDREMERLGSGKLGNAMLEEKTKMMEHFKLHSKELKNSNVKFTKEKMNEVISELMCNKGESSFLMIAAYAVYYKIQIYMLDENKHIYLKFVYDHSLVSEEDTNHICVLYKNPRSKTFASKYYKKKVSTKEELKALDNMCELVQYDKPLNGISTYTVAKLEEMAKKLHLSLAEENHEDAKKNKKMNKTELYHKIGEKIAWVM